MINGRNVRLNCLFGFIVGASCLGAVLPQSARAMEPWGDRPDWIWATPQGALASQNVSQSQPVTLSKSIVINGSLRAVHIAGGADFCHLTIVVNRQVVAVVDAYADWFELDATRYCRQGNNLFELRATPVAGPSAVAAEFRIELADGARVKYLTGEAWETSGVEGWKTVSFGKVLPQMWLPERPAKVEPFEDYTQWRRALRDDSGKAVAEADAATFDVEKGYEIQHVLRAGPEQSSWVSMGVSTSEGGQLGRAGILIGREDQGFLRVQFPDGPAGAAQIASVPCEETLREPRGIAPHGGASGVMTWTANANNSKAVFTLRDDGKRLTANKQFDFPGGVGHGRNDLFWTLTPRVDWNRGATSLGVKRLDELIYSIHGDAVDVPHGDGIEDRTSPYRDARRGKATREGHLLLMRREPSDSQWSLTVLAAGLRNPYGVAMNEHGEKFTYDADAEFDMGAPWYRPTRIVHLTSGADYGWRGVTKQWPPYFPDHADNAFPVCTVGKGSPTSVAFGYPADFPEVDRQSLYVLDWAYGRVLQVHLTPRGAGYRGRCSTFLQGRPLNVTDLGFVDGDMLLITGGRKTQSNMYRVRFVGSPSKAAETSQQRRRQAFGRQQRLIRRRVERFHRPIAGQAAKRRGLIETEVLPLLNDPDPQIRYAARIALEHQPVDDWRGLAFESDDAVTKITMLTALAAANDPPYERIVAALSEVDWRKLPPAEQVRLLRCDALCSQANVDEALESKVVSRHLEMCRSTEEQFLPTGIGKSVVQESLLPLLAREVAAATPLAMERLMNATSQHDELLYLFALRNVREGWTRGMRRDYFAAFANTKGYLGGDGMPGFIQQIHAEAVKAVPASEREALGELLTLERDAAPELPPQRPHVAKWTLEMLSAELEKLPQGDAHRGRQIFHEALCARCHRKGADGRPIGPDLTNVGSRFRRNDLLRSVVHPSDVVAQKFRQYSIATADGRQLTGIGTWGGDYRAPTLRLVTNPLRPDKAVEIPKREIARRQWSKISPMPVGLLDGFNPTEVQDLLAFLLGT